MNIKLFFQAITKFILGVVIIGLLLFIPANTISYWNGWLFMGILFIPMFIAGIIMMIKSPELLRKRLNAKEKENEQKQVVKLKAKTLVIDEIELLECELPVIKIRVVCSKGTYIRALARDIGEALNSGAHLIGLIRTRVGEVKLEDCIQVEGFAEWLEKQEIENINE